jgi:hypothetical protein
LSLFRLNRLLLEDAYPEIERSRKSIIYVGEKRNSTRVDSLRPRQPELPYYINKDLRVFEIIVNDTRDKIGYYKCALMIANKNFRNEKERLEKEIEKLEDLEEKQNDKEKKYKLDHLRRILSGYTYFLAYLLSSAYLDDLARRFGLEYILEFIGRLEDWEPMSAFVYANSGKLKISQDFNDQLMEEISKNFSGNALARIKFRDFDDVAIPFWETTFREERDSKSQNS